MISLLRGYQDNSSVWYYMKIDKVKLIRIKKELHKQNLNLEEYGEILFSGYGENPPENIKQQILNY